jgi:DNA-directed RNA polymerase specialized sigma24 family protein
LWRQAKAGDLAAYEQLFAMHADRALLFIRARLGKLRDKIEPEDVLQDAFLAAHRAWDGFDYTDDGAHLRWTLTRLAENASESPCASGDSWWAIPAFPEPIL